MCAILRLRNKKAAPGPDGVPGIIWAKILTLNKLEERLRRLFTSCLEQGVFPSLWKDGHLILIQKDNRPAENLSSYRPIVLLNEVGKLFERVIAARIVHNLTSCGIDLSDRQFGFRAGRSTIDAILKVKNLTEQAVSQGGVALAVSLDIANAFNTLPWECIKEALKFHRILSHLCRNISSYLTDRKVSLWDKLVGKI